jgi:hypothetical protein
MPDTHTPAPWRYEPGTKTIRSVPANYWLASIDSWDGAVDHAANAQLIAAAPEMLAALKVAEAHLYDSWQNHAGGSDDLETVRNAIAKAEGRS